MAHNLRPYGPGKFSTILDAYVYSITVQGGCDDEAGSVDTNGSWFGMMRGGRSIFLDHDPLLETLNVDEQDFLTGCAGAIVREDSDGFVAVTYFDTTAAMDSAWTQIVDALDESVDGATD